jgi:hypothetical protein
MEGNLTAGLSTSNIKQRKTLTQDTLNGSSTAIEPILSINTVKMQQNLIIIVGKIALFHP